MRRVLLLCMLVAASALASPHPTVRPGVPLEFPRDHGSHPEFRTEWWYVTGWLEAPGRTLGVQITFFRTRPAVAEHLKSAFAARELLFAHAALADPRHGRLRHDQKSARTGFGLAHARTGTTDVAIDDWRLHLDGSTYHARLAAREFTLALEFRATQPILLQGEGGYSRKGPLEAQASYYYSRPQLVVAGTVQIAGEPVQVGGRAWLDHEWSSELMAPEARGWDWVGINLDDGGALMAFRMRREAGPPLWRAAKWRRPDGTELALAADAVELTPLEHWRSPRTGAEYPVAMRVRLGERVIELAPMMADQELDARASVGAVYWEGAVVAREASRVVGRGYLELTGYWKRLRLQ